jgi:hypothetical protein
LFGELYHPPQIPQLKIAAIFFLQLCRQLRRNPLAVFVTFVLQDDGIHNTPDLPKRQSERTVRVCGDNPFILLYELRHFIEQGIFRAKTTHLPVNPLRKNLHYTDNRTITDASSANAVILSRSYVFQKFRRFRFDVRGKMAR